MKVLSLPLTEDAMPVVALGRAGGASLDVLRFLAASFILLFHYGQSAPVTLDQVSPVFAQGWLATDFFLLLSGYVLSRAYGGRLVSSGMRRSHFFLKRFARLWPAHVIVLTAFAAFVLVSSLAGFAPAHADKYGGMALFAQAFLVHGWGIIREPAWNVPTWTLSALLVCYALFSVYIGWLYNRSRWVLLAVAVCVLALGHGLAQGLAHHALVDLPFAWGLLRAVPLFIIGNLIERLTTGWRIGRRVYWTALAAAFAGIWLLSDLPRHAVSDSLILVLLATILAVSGAVTFGETAVTRRMGRASFALFLTHSLVGAVWFSAMPKLVLRFGLGAPEQWALWATGVFAAVVTAFLFDALIDKPLSERVGKLSFVRGGI